MLGVVIGITSIVGMTALIRGFDQSLRDLDRADRAEHHLPPAFGVTSFANGVEFSKLMKRPNLTSATRARSRRRTRTLQYVDIELGARPRADDATVASSTAT